MAIEICHCGHSRFSDHHRGKGRCYECECEMFVLPGIPGYAEQPAFQLLLGYGEQL